MLYLLYFRLITSRMFLHLSHIQGLYWFRRGLWSWGSHPQTPGLRTNREPKYKRRRTVRVSSLIAARQPWCTHTSRVWRRPCEKPCRISFAPVDVSWSYWICKPVGGRTAEGMLKQRLWWEMPQWIGFRTRVQFPPGPLFNKLANLQECRKPLNLLGFWHFCFSDRDQVFPGCGSAYAVYGKNLFSGFLIGFEGVDGVGICGPGEFQGFSVLASEASGS